MARILPEEKSMSGERTKAPTFFERYLIGAVRHEEIDDYVDAWHSNPHGLGLHEFLEMSEEEYALWLRNPDALPDIARARTENERRMSRRSKSSTAQIAGRPTGQRGHAGSGIGRAHRRH